MSLLNKKKVLITGASSGIGEACAFAFAREGCSLTLVARREERLTKIQKILENKYSVKVNIITLDVTKKEAVFSALNDKGAIDILLNNAGLALGIGKVHETNTEFYDTMIDTNVKGLLYVTQAIVPEMVKNGRGDIINISSIAGHEVYPGGAVYCASKHANIGFMRALARELAPKALQ